LPFTYTPWRLPHQGMHISEQNDLNMNDLILMKYPFD
jgi:hypothetical protein